MTSLLVTRTELLPQSLASLVALLHPRCSGEEAHRLLADSQDLLPVARAHGVAPLVFHLWQSEIAVAVPPAEAENWRRMYLASLTRSVQTQAQAVAALQALADAGVEPVVMRGLWLAQTVYEDPALRPSQDLDLLVPPEAGTKVAEVLESQGFTRFDDPHEDLRTVPQDAPPSEVTGADGVWRKPLLEGAATGVGRDLWVDLHTELLVVSGGWWPYRPTYADLYARSVPWAFAGAGLRAFSPGAAILVQCDNVMRHALARDVRNDRLLGYYDVLRLLPKMTEEDWSVLTEDGRRLHLGVHIAVVLDSVKRLWEPESSIPDPAELGVGPVAWRVARHACSRPRWLGHRGRLGLVQACALGSLWQASRYLLRNLRTGLVVTKSQPTLTTRERPI